MGFISGKKKAVLVPAGPDKHLFIILTDPNKNGMQLLVPISSIKEGRYFDQTCIIRANEKSHSFIRKDSYVFYKRIEARHTNHIVMCVEKRSYIEKEDINDDLFKRVCDGIEKSPHTPRWAKIDYKNSN